MSVYGVLSLFVPVLRKWCHDNNVSELAPHNGGKQLAQIWREEITSLSPYMYAYAHELYLTAVVTKDVVIE